MSIDINVQYAIDIPDLPTEDKIKYWVNTSLENLADNAELTLRIVDEQEGKQLNEQWRKSSGPTNVLSFSYNDDVGTGTGLHGDIVVCAPVIAREADEQCKSLDAHWAHIVIHGVLHLLGYDHNESKEAEEMENLEKNILDKLGFPHPYITVSDK